MSSIRIILESPSFTTCTRSKAKKEGVENSATSTIFTYLGFRMFRTIVEDPFSWSTSSLPTETGFYFQNLSFSVGPET